MYGQLVKQEFPSEKVHVHDYSYLEKLLQLEKEPKLVNKLSDVFSILSKSDALTIFLVTKDGLKSKVQTPGKIGLTKKQYYTRLKELVDLGLLDRNEGRYTHTTLGNVIYEKHLMGFLNSMKASKEFEMIDFLKKTSKFNAEEIINFVSKLNPQINSGACSNETHFEVIYTFDGMVKKVLEITEFAEEEILLTARFSSDLIINAILKRANSGLQIKIISDVNMTGSYFISEKDKIVNGAKDTNESINVVANHFYPYKIEQRHWMVPYYMIIIDKKQVALEIVNGHKPAEFKMAMFVKEKKFSSQMVTEFDCMWKMSSMNHALLQHVPVMQDM